MPARAPMDSFGIEAVARVYVVVRDGDDARVVDLEEASSVTVGRSPDASIRLSEERCAPLHARIGCDARGMFVEDLGSAQGIRINRERDKLRGARRRLDVGDVVRIGKTELIAIDTRGRREREPSAVDILPGPPPSLPCELPIIVDPATHRVFDLATRVAPAPIAVLITGETGSGKELLAEHIHRASLRPSGPFVRLNCGAIPDTLLESELFGYDRGAFTGADRRKVGLLEAGHRGTLFLDEVGEMQPAVQAKLLRAIETGRFMRLGGTNEVGVDIRIISATHRNLEAEVAARRFRQDLFFRLAAFVLRVPPLRERPAEIVPLAEVFAHRFAQRLGILPPHFTSEALAALQRHDWPGNVRELRHAVQHAMVITDHGEIDVAHLPEHLRARTSGFAPIGPMRDQLESVERQAIEEALRAEGGNQTRAAERLGLSRRAFLYKLAKYRRKL